MAFLFSVKSPTLLLLVIFAYMVIYGIDGNKLLDAILAESAEHEQELSKSDFVKLSWESDVKLTIPVGSYIIPFEDGLKYRLLNSYIPAEIDKGFRYDISFHHPLMWLSRVPFLYVENDLKQQEWSFDGLTVSALEYVCKAINEAFGITDDTQKFTYTLCGTVDGSVSFSVSSNDILSVLSSIAQACKDNSCEWHLSWEHRCLYFGQIAINLGEEVPLLKVHDNIQTASVSESKEDYYNCFYPQGSTKNMSRKAQVGTGNVATLARLGLDTTKHPDGCIYVGTDGKVITKAQFGASNAIKQTLALSFDEIYPHLDLYAYNIRKRTRYLKNDTTGEYELDSKGNKKIYTVWYMRLAYCTTTKDTSKVLVNTTTDNGVTHYWYDYDLDAKKQVLQGYTPKGTFKVNTHTTNNQYDALTQSLVGQPSGQDGFELYYHEANETLPASETTGDSGVSVLKGDYEIKMYQSGDTIIPTNEEDGLIPHGKALPDLTCNIVVLFNIVMGEYETKLAQEELAARTIKEINRRTQDNNNYTAHSNAVEFARKNPHLYIGQRVIYDDGFGYQLSTRIIKLVTKLDYPIIQDITVGNQAIKGTISQLKEDVNNILSGNFSGGGLNSAQVGDIVRNYVDSRFLSKTKDDKTDYSLEIGKNLTVEGLGKFLKGLDIGKGSSITAEGIATLLALVLPNAQIDANGVATLIKVIAQSLVSPDFDATSETGFSLNRRKDGKYQLSLTDLIVWGKAVFNELEIRKLSYVGGNMVFSSCGSKIKRVEETDTAYRCYFYQDDGTTATTNLWKVNDQVRSQTFNIREGKYENVSNRSYWRRVTAVGDDYIDLSKTDCEQGSDAPMEGDSIVQFGNRTDTDRQSLIYVIVNGEEAPAIIWYDGVNSYTLTGRQTAIISPRKVHFHTKVFRVENYDGTTTPLVFDCGAWQAGKNYYLNNRVSHNGGLWLCMVPEGQVCTSEPKEGNDDWLLQVEKGESGISPISLVLDLKNGDVFYRKGQEHIATITASIQMANVDITSEYHPSQFVWTRESDATLEEDAAWNERHLNIGLSVDIGFADMVGRTAIVCTLYSAEGLEIDKNKIELN